MSMELVTVPPTDIPKTHSGRLINSEFREPLANKKEVPVITSSPDSRRKLCNKTYVNSHSITRFCRSRKHYIYNCTVRFVIIIRMDVPYQRQKVCSVFRGK